jgi:secondary thiamine-phosphate synthase enzyme
VHTTFVIETRGPGLTEFTPRIVRWIDETCLRDGVLTLFVRHTSASLLVTENASPEVPRDLLAFFTRLVPPSDDPAMSWVEHRDEGPDDMPAHIKAALLPVSLSIPVAGGRLRLGTWQGVFLVEHRARSHRREVAATLLPC